MQHNNAFSKNPIYKVIKTIATAAELDNWRKTGIFGVTSSEPVNGSSNFTLELYPASVDGRLTMRQTSVSGSVPKTFVRMLLSNDTFGPWVNNTSTDGESTLYVYGNGTADENFLELQAVYNQAKLLEPGGQHVSSLNPANVIVAPADYRTLIMNKIRITLDHFEEMNLNTESGVGLSIASINDVIELFCDFTLVPGTIALLSDLASWISEFEDPNSEQLISDWYSVSIEDNGPDLPCAIILNQISFSKAPFSVINVSIMTDMGVELVTDVTVEVEERGYLMVDTPYVNIKSLTGDADVLLMEVDVVADNIILKGLNAMGEFIITPGLTSNQYINCIDMNGPIAPVFYEVQTNCIIVNAIGTPTENGIALQTAYDTAKLMTPNGVAKSATNRISLVVVPGKYENCVPGTLEIVIPSMPITSTGASVIPELEGKLDNEIAFNMTLPFSIGLIFGETWVNSVQPVASTGTMQDVADSLAACVGEGGVVLTDAFIPSVVGNKIVFTPILTLLGVQVSGVSLSLYTEVGSVIVPTTINNIPEQLPFTVDADFIDIVSLDGNRSVLLDGISVATGTNAFLKGIDTDTAAFTVASATPDLICENCKGSYYSFGYFNANSITNDVALLGTYIDCEALDWSFGSYDGSSSSESYDFALGSTGVPVKFIRCKAVNNSFGYYIDANYNKSLYVHSIYAEKCEAITDSFCVSPNLANLYAGDFIDCTGVERCFGNISNTTVPFNFLRCKSGDDSFCFESDLGGTAIDCIGEDQCFGATNSSSMGKVSGTCRNCTGGGLCFGGPDYDGGGISGSLYNCTMTSMSAGCSILDSGRLYYCKLVGNLEVFPTPAVGGRLILCIDGTDTVITV